MVKNAKITDLKFDDKNLNKGSEFGNSLIEKSFQKFGAGRSVLIDKNNRLIGGNKSAAKFGELGGKNVLIVDAGKDTLVAVRRKDIDLDSPEGREMALAENATAKANIVWDAEVIEVLSEIVQVQQWGVIPEGQAVSSGVNEDGEEFEEGMSPSLGDGSAKEFKQQMFPLGIVVDKQTQINWNEYKTSISISRDSEAFCNLLKSIK